MKKDSTKQFNRLIKKISQGEKNALEDFYNIYGKFLFVAAKVITKSSYLADEAVNDALVKIWKSSKTMGEISNPNGWLYILTVNCAKDILKKERKYICVENLENVELSAEYSYNDEFTELISNLSEQEQQVIIFKIVRGLSFKQIAKELNSHISSVSSLYYRAIEKLKNI